MWADDSETFLRAFAFGMAVFFLLGAVILVFAGDSVKPGAALAVFGCLNALIGCAAHKRLRAKAASSASQSGRQQARDWMGNPLK